MTVSSLDLALFHYQDHGNFSGIMCIHVDDVLFAGDERFFNRVVSPIMKSLKVGEISERSFRYIGVNIEEGGDGIKLHLEDYIATLNTVQIHKEKAMRRIDELGAREMEKLQSTCWSPQLAVNSNKAGYCVFCL